MKILLERSLFTFILLAFAGLLTYCGDYGEDYKGEDENETVAAGDSANAANAYPRDEVREPEEVNVSAEDDEYELPMETEAAVSLMEKRQILALLRRQKTNMLDRIEELEDLPGDASDNTVVRGDIDKLRLYVDKLDKEIVDVRKADVGSMQAAAESALAAVKGAGALMQTPNIRIDRGF